MLKQTDKWEETQQCKSIKCSNGTHEIKSYADDEIIIGGVRRSGKQSRELESVARSVGICAFLRCTSVAIQTRTQERRRHKCPSACW